MKKKEIKYVKWTEMYLVLALICGLLIVFSLQYIVLSDTIEIMEDKYNYHYYEENKELKQKGVVEICSSSGLLTIYLETAEDYRDYTQDDFLINFTEGNCNE